MARQSTMSTMLTQLRAALGQSLTVPAIGSGDDVILMQLLSDKQKDLASMYSWPFLEDRFDYNNIQVGSRYLAFPTMDDEGDATVLDLERPIKVEVFWGAKWSPVAYGIGSEQFNFLNSDLPGNLQDPITNWRWSQEGMFEIWPMNATVQTLRFTGQRAMDTLAALTDTADLDDRLLVLAVAADILARQNQKDADRMSARYQRRLFEVRANYPAWKDLNLGQDADEDLKPKTISIKPAIAIAGG